MAAAVSWTANTRYLVDSFRCRQQESARPHRANGGIKPRQDGNSANKAGQTAVYDCVIHVNSMCDTSRSLFISEPKATPLEYLVPGLPSCRLKMWSPPVPDRSQELLGVPSLVSFFIAFILSPSAHSALKAEPTWKIGEPFPRPRGS